MNRNKVYAKSKENQIIIKALNMYGRVPEMWELLKEIERLNNIINELEKWLKGGGIIDLIEVGDYVNGVEVENIDDEWITMSDTKVPILKSIANGMIKSVITHEQMEQMAYKVGK